MSEVTTTARKPVIGLAGGIGAGKTSVARLLESLGARVLNFDELAHLELNEPDVRAILRRWWGASVFGPDGRVNRERVASIVFQEPRELTRLEGLLYPRLRERTEDLVAAGRADPAVKGIVLDAPKLFEAGLDQMCDAVIFVEAAESLRRRRIETSRGWTGDEMRRRENLQNSLDMKMAKADHVVSNQSSMNELRSQVERVFAAVLSSFA